MQIYGLLVAIFFLLVSVAVVVLAVLFCLVAQLCIAAPPNRSSEQGDYAASIQNTGQESFNQDDGVEGQDGKYVTGNVRQFLSNSSWRTCVSSQHNHVFVNQPRCGFDLF